MQIDQAKIDKIIRAARVNAHKLKALGGDALSDLWGKAQDMGRAEIDLIKAELPGVLQQQAQTLKSTAIDAANWTADHAPAAAQTVALKIGGAGGYAIKSIFDSVSGFMNKTVKYGSAAALITIVVSCGQDQINPREDGHSWAAAHSFGALNAAKGLVEGVTMFLMAEEAEITEGDTEQLPHGSEPHNEASPDAKPRARVIPGPPLILEIEPKRPSPNMI